MHRLKGTTPVILKKGEWTYQWKAPSTNVGAITFYACFLAADNNATNDSGDQTYYTKLVINPASSSIKNNIGVKEVTVYPNPTQKLLNIQTNSFIPTEVRIIDLEGNVVSQFHWQAGRTFQAFDLKSNTTPIKAGLYFLSLNSENKRFLQKIWVE